MANLLQKISWNENGYQKPDISGYYIEQGNDNLMSKTPNGVPILVKHLDGRNPDLAYRLAGRRTFKIKKRKINSN